MILRSSMLLTFTDITDAISNTSSIRDRYRDRDA